MTALSLRRISVEGFGVYATPTSFAFAEGVNVLVAPNEAGKSTLIAALAATLYGLPAKNDNTGFTQARYRSWLPHRDFWGEVEFALDGAVYAVRRGFANHQVRLLRRGGDGEQVLFDGQHNPLGDSGQAEAYLRQLGELVQVTSLEVFERTFCVSQPMPEQAGISSAVQQLVTGSSNRRVDEVLRELMDRFCDLSSKTADFNIVIPGKQARNRRNPGRIETLEQEIAALEQTLEQGRATLAELTATQHELRRLDQVIRERSASVESDKTLLAAWERWQQLREKRDDALDEQCRLQRALEEYRKFDDQYRALYQQISDSYREFEDAPDDLRERFQALLDAERDLATARDRLRQLETQRDDLRRIVAECEQTILNRHRDIADKPDLLRDYDQLKVLLERCAVLARREDSLRAQLKAIEDELAALPPWGQLGEYPGAVVEAARERVRRFRLSQRDYEQVARRAEAVRAQLSQQFAPFKDMPNEQLAELERYELDRQRLVDRQRAAAAALSQIEATSREIDALTREADELYGRLVDAPPDLIPRLEAAVAVRGQIEELQHQHARLLEQLNRPLPDRRLFWMTPVALALALAAGAVAWSLRQDLLVAGVSAVAALIAGALGVWLFWPRPEHDIALISEQLELERQLQSLRQELSQQLEVIRPFADLSPLAVGRLQAEMEARSRLLRRAADLRDRLPPSEELEQARHDAAEAQRELDAFDMRMSAYARHFTDGVGPNARLCLRLRDELERLERDIRQYEREFFDPGMTAQLTSISVEDLPPHWGPVRRLAEVTGAKPGTAQDVIQWVLAVKEEEWNVWAAQCERAARLARERDRLTVELEALLALEDGVSERGRVEREIERLRAAIAPFDETDDRQRLEFEVFELRNVRRQAETAQSKLNDLSDESELIRQVEEAMGRVEQLRRPLEPYLAPVQGDVERARQRYDAYRELAHGADKRKAERDGVLRGHGADSPDALRRGEIEARNRQETHEKALEELRAQHVLIRELERLGNPEEVQRRYTELKARVAETESELAAAQTAYQDALRQEASLQGRTLINVAQMEVECAERRAELARLMQERDALALAFQLVNDARRRYQENYRERLAESITAHFARLSRTTTRFVQLDEEFCLRLTREDGGEFSLAQLSQGARDQLYLAVRLAVADLLADTVVLPIILDDPFLNYDDQRIPELRHTLAVLAERQQVLLFSHRPELLTWGVPVKRHAA